MYVTPRTLLAIIRLAQAMAKLNFRNEVKQPDVDEAIKLMDFSIRSLRNMKGNDKEKKKDQRDQRNNDKMSMIINAVRELITTTESQQLHIADILKKLQKGPLQIKLKREELTDCLDHYKKLNVVYVDADENVIFL